MPYTQQNYYYQNSEPIPSTTSDNPAEVTDPIYSTRNTAIASIVGVIVGSWMVFRAQAPNKNDTFVSEGDMQTTLRGQTGGSKVARSSAHQDQD